MDPILNCVISACCPAESAQQLAALTTWMAAQMAAPVDECERYARLLLATFDFAPKGKLAPLVHEIVRLSKAPSPQA